MDKLIFSWRLTPQQKNRRLWILLMYSLLGLLLIGSLLIGCKPKAKPAADSAASAEVVDTIRPALEQKADQAAAQSETDRKLGTQSVTDYTNAAKRYDSLRAELDKN